MMKLPILVCAKNYRNL